MAIHILPSGKMAEIAPRKGTSFTAEELHELVGGWLECILLSDGRLMWLNEEGKLRGLELNVVATEMARDVLMRGDFIVGPAVVMTRQEAGE